MEPDVSDDQPNRPTTESEDDTGQVSTGPSGPGQGPEQLGGADAVPDTPDKNFSEDSGSPGRGSSSADEDRS